MPQQLLWGMLIGAAAAALLYLTLTGRLLPRGSDQRRAVRQGARKQRTTVAEMLSREGDHPADSLPAGVQERPDGLPFVVEKRTTQKIVINIKGQVHEYDSLAEVPAEFRALIDRARRSASSRITVEVNGKRYTYNSRDEVPPGFRHLLPPEQVG